MATGRLSFQLASVRVEEATLVMLHMKRIVVDGSQLAGFRIAITPPFIGKVRDIVDLNRNPRIARG